MDILNNPELGRRIKFWLAQRYKIDPGSVFKLESSRDNLVFSVDNRLIARISLVKSIEDVKQEADFIAYLRIKDVPCPAAIDVFAIGLDELSFPCVCFEYIKHDKSQAFDERQIVDAAYVLAQVHANSIEYLRTNSYTQIRTATGDLEKLNALAKDSQAQNKQEILEEIEWAIKFYTEERLKGIDSAVEYIIHNDFRSQNVLLDDEGKINSVIDFDWAIKSFSPKPDIAHSAMEFSMKDGEELCNEKLYKLFVDSYCEAAGVDFDIENLREWSRFRALTDAAYYFISFPERTTERFESYMYDKSLYFKLDSEL